MKNLRKLISLCLTLCILLSLVPVGALAEETEQAPISGELTWVSEEDLDSEELYEGYALQQFCGGTSYFGTAAGERLSGDEKAMYDALVPIIRQIADGNRASATITIGQGSSVDSNAVFTGSDLSEGALARVLDALMSDLPYECYWYDKTTGCKLSYSGWDTITSMTFYCTVGVKYRGADQYTADTTKTGSAKLAADNAKSILSKYAGASDYEKLIGYRDEICALVSYDDTAADTSNYYKVDLNPWQLINVFDGKASTNVVCEGYSKAFMYLCDMTEFSGDISCHTVTGYMNGGGHMWNIVDIEGKHYLADITNSDTGTSGSDGSLFLAGGTGTAAGGYTVSGIQYAYKTDMIELWGTADDSLLALEAENYEPEGGDNEEVIGGKCGENLTWEYDKDSEILTISGTGDMYNFDFSGENANPWRSFKVEKVIIESGVTNIGQYAFTKGPEYNIGSISIPNTVTRFEDFAFYCSGTLSEISIPESVEYIGTRVFSECMLEHIIVDPDSIYFCTDASGALLTFDGSKLIRLPATFGGKYIVPEGVQTIEKDAFMGCSGMTEISIPETVTNIGESAFYYCIGLNEVTLPVGVTKTSDLLFSLCENITKITLPQNLTTLGIGTFHGCTNLKEIVIPSGVTNIGDRVFGWCENLEQIVFSGNAPTFHETAFDNVETSAKYPANDPTWIPDVMQNYGGTITWIPYGGEHVHEYDANHKCECGAIGGSCGKYVCWMIDEEGTLRISGSGAMDTIGFDSATGQYLTPWKDWQDSIKSVVIESGITDVVDQAIGSCKNLETIMIPATLTKLGDFAILYCPSLKDIQVDDENQHYCTVDGVLYSKDMTTLIKYPACRIGTEYTVPDTVTKLMHVAFDSASKLVSITLPDSITALDTDTFADCTSLKNIRLPKNLTDMKAGSIFWNCSSLESIEIPDNVQVIGSSAFAYCPKLKQVSLPSCLKKLDGHVFGRCESLETITIPAGVSCLEYKIFEGSGLKSIIFEGDAPNFHEETFTNIAATAYYPLDNATWTGAVMQNYGGTITWIPYGREHVHKYGDDHKCECGAIGGTCGENLTWTFDLESGLLTIWGTGEMDQYYDKNQPWEEYNDDIIKVTVDEGVTSLSTYALFECEAMTQLNLPASLADIYENSLPIVGAMTAINVAADNSSYCTDNGVLYSKGMQALMKYPAHKTDASYTVPNSVTVIAFNAFAGCMNLNKLFFEGNAPFIDETSFEMTAFTICYPANDPTWTSDVMLDYGGNITWKPDCGGNHSLVILPAVEATCQATGLTDGVSCEVCGFVSRAQEVVPVSDHKYNAQNVCRFCGITGGNCGAQVTNVKWSLDAKGTLTIYGTGDMSGVDSSMYAPWSAHRDRITTVVVEEGVETIGSNMLGLLPNLKSVTLPQSLLHISKGAFHTTPSLKSIYLHDGIQTIGNSAFQNGGLTEVTLPENTKIGAYVFDNCTALKKVTMNTALDSGANGSCLFRDCTALEEVVLGDKVNWISQFMFSGCTALERIVIPGSAKLIAGNAFDGCTALEEVLMESGVEHIGPDAFARCTALKEITFPDSITELEEAVFNYCENLDQIWFTGDAPVIDSSAFSTLKVTAYYPGNNATWTKDARGYYGSTLIKWVPFNHAHSYTATVVSPTCTKKGYTVHLCACGNSYIDSYVNPTGNHTYSGSTDTTCDVCGAEREEVVVKTVPMFRMYDPNSGEHFYSGSELERQFLVDAGWHYEGVGFNFPEEGAPVHRLYDPVYGEHLYTMDEAEMNRLLAKGWNYENVAFNSAGTDEVPQYRLHNPNAKRGAYHFTGSTEERDLLISFGWEYQGIGWYSSLE